MTPFVVDTNVAIVANGRETDADEQCRLSCIKRLRSLADDEVVAIDNLGLILAEYKKRLHFRECQAWAMPSSSMYSTTSSRRNAYEGSP